jgi:hypothetical protein
MEHLQARVPCAKLDCTEPEDMLLSHRTAKEYSRSVVRGISFCRSRKAMALPCAYILHIYISDSIIRDSRVEWNRLASSVLLL